MNIQDYLCEMKKIEGHLTNFIESEDKDEENLQKLKEMLDQQKILEDLNDFKVLMKIVANISNNHHHKSDFYSKVEQILQIFKQPIQSRLSAFDIKQIFEENKRIMWYLIKEGFLNLDSNFDLSTKDFYIREMKTCYDFVNDCSNNPYLENDEIFSQKLNIGENDSYICSLIQKDSIESFIKYFNAENLSAESLIPSSIYETNLYLLQNKQNLIEYSAFCGSIQIFQYLMSKSEEIKSSLWLFAIHSQNLEIIFLLENNKVSPPNNSYYECFLESIKCHHNSIADYFFNNYICEKESENYENAFVKSLKYYNFEFIENDCLSSSSIFDLIENRYISLAKEKDLNVNQMRI